MDQRSCIFSPVDGVLNPVMWSLVVEIQFYTIIPLIFVAFKKTLPHKAPLDDSCSFFSGTQSFSVVCLHWPRPLVSPADREQLSLGFGCFSPRYPASRDAVTEMDAEIIPSLGKPRFFADPTNDDR